MAATNTTTKKTTTNQPTVNTPTKVTTSPAGSTTRSTTITSTAPSSPAVQQATASQAATQAAASRSAGGTGIFNWQLPNIMPSLDQFLGLPAVIDWQDIAIRTSMVVVGVVLVLLVAWAFLRGKQQTTVNVQQPQNQHIEKAAVEAAEVA